ncbi:MAG: hypothetical protein K0Q79_671 [Flavipsychrobacter sp.]|nr:hypothetical protein [Flavipsychrobacter sp.]
MFNTAYCAAGVIVFVKLHCCLSENFRGDKAEQA